MLLSRCSISMKNVETRTHSTHLLFRNVQVTPRTQGFKGQKLPVWNKTKSGKRWIETPLQQAPLFQFIFSQVRKFLWSSKVLDTHKTEGRLLLMSRTQESQNTSWTGLKTTQINCGTLKLRKCSHFYKETEGISGNYRPNGLSIESWQNSSTAY